jgi:RNA polymerase sigma-70 factor (ECF subfamily)
VIHLGLIGNVLSVIGADVKAALPAALAYAQPTSETTPLSSRVPREARLRQLVDQYMDFVGRVLRNAGTPPAEVDDALQRTFIIADRRLDDIRAGSEKSFLLQIALRVAAHARRSAARRREVPEAELPERVESATPEQLIGQKRARQMLDQVLDQMGQDLRTVFILYEFEQMSMAEIAGAVGIPSGTVASRLRRARADFRERVAALEATVARKGEVKP